MDLISPDQGGLRQAEARERTSVFVLDLESNAPRRRRGEIQDQVAALKPERMRQDLSPRVSGAQGGEAIGAQRHTLHVDAGRLVVAKHVK